MLGLAIEDRGRQYQLQRTKDVRQVTNEITVHKLTITNESVGELTITNGVCANASCSRPTMLDEVTKIITSDYSEATTAFCPLHLVVGASEVT